MNKKDLVMLIMAKKTLDYQKDPNPDNWVTISGAKVHLDEGGKIDGGAKGKFNGKSYSGTKKSHKSATGSSESSKKYESKAREAVEYWVNTHYKNPSDKNIKDSVESVRMQMESMVKSAERNLNDAKKTGKEDLIKKYQDKFDEAKGTLEALNNYYDGGTVKKEPEKNPATKSPEVGDKGMAFLKRMSVIHSSFDEDTGYMARDIAQQLKDGKSLEEIKDYFYDNIDKWGSNKEQEKKQVDKFLEAVKRADKGLDPWKKEEKEDKNSWRAKLGKEKYDELMEKVSSNKTWAEKLKSSMGEKRFNEAMEKSLENAKKLPAEEPKTSAPKSPKKKVDPASSEAQAKRQAIADDMMKRPFVKGKVEEASKKLIAEANKDYGGDHETSVMLENVVKDKDGAYITLKIVAKDKTGKSRFPQSHSMTFKVGDLTKEQKKLYFSK